MLQLFPAAEWAGPGTGLECAFSLSHSLALLSVHRALCTQCFKFSNVATHTRELSPLYLGQAPFGKEQTDHSTGRRGSWEGLAAGKIRDHTALAVLLSRCCAMG